MKSWKKKYQILSWVTPLVVVLDQLTKWEVVKNFSLGQTRSIVPGIFDLTYVRNTGAAFGILAHADARWRVPFFVLVPLVALVAIFQVFRRIGEKDLKLAYALALVMGGAVGNLIDRAWLNYVVDFLLFHWNYEWQFPAFNIADSAICVGVGILMLDLFHAPDSV